MNILFLSHKIPYPPHQGDRIAVWHRIEHLARSHRLFLAFPCFYTDELKHLETVRAHAARLETVLINRLWAKLKSLRAIFSARPLTLAYFYSRALDKKIQRVIAEEKIDVIYVYSSSMAQYALCAEDTKRVMDFVDSDSHKWLQYSRHTRWPFSFIYRLEYRRMKRFEQLIAAKFDQTLAISEDEKKLFSTYVTVKDKEMRVIPNGVDLEYFKPGQPQSAHSGISRMSELANVRIGQLANSPTRQLAELPLVFMGAMDYFANVDAVVYFYREIFPLVLKEIPEALFYIIGSRPAGAVRELARDARVFVSGFVPDVRPYLKEACVCVAPLRIAQGMQNKVVQSMAMQKPVVVTGRANAGIGAQHGRDVMVADTPGDFSRCIIELIRDEKLRGEIARNARAFVERNFRWDAQMDKLQKVLEDV